MININGFSNIAFEGVLERPKKEEYFSKKGPTKKNPNVTYEKVNFSGITPSQSQIYFELFGMNEDMLQIKLRHIHEDGSKTYEDLTISAEEAYQNKDIMEKASRKFRIQLGPYDAEVVVDNNGVQEKKTVTKYEYDITCIDSYSFLLHIKDCFEKKRFEGKNVTVYGSASPNVYKKKTRMVYTPNLIREIKAGSEIMQDAILDLPFVATKDSFKALSAEKVVQAPKVEREYDLQIYTPIWNKNNQKNELVAFNAVVNLENVDEENIPVMAEIYNGLLTKDNEGKSLKSKKYYAGIAQFLITSQRAELELTAIEKQMIKMKMTTEEQIMKEKNLPYTSTGTKFELFKLRADGPLIETDVDESLDFYVYETDEVINKNQDEKADPTVAAASTTSFKL